MASYPQRQQFTQALMSELARLWREDETRFDRGRIEEIGRRYEVDRDEALRLFVDSRGDLWEGEFIESEEEPGWVAVALTDVPTTGTSLDSSV